MNLILFESDEIAKPLARSDPRAIHIFDTLRMKTGDRFDAGVVNGPRGKALITSIDATAIGLEFTIAIGARSPDPIDLIVGMPRPQTARRILHDASALGARRIAFVATARSDPNYAKSRLWESGEWRRHLVDGAQQAFDTRIPLVGHGMSLATAINDAVAGEMIAFDNYEATAGFAAVLRAGTREKLHAGNSVTLAFGPERGWDTVDRERLRTSGFILASLGSRVMRTETAIVSAVAVLRAELGWQ